MSRLSSAVARQKQRAKRRRAKRRAAQRHAEGGAASEPGMEVPTHRFPKGTLTRGRAPERFFPNHTAAIAAGPGTVHVCTNLGAHVEILPERCPDTVAVGALHVRCAFRELRGPGVGRLTRVWARDRESSRRVVAYAFPLEGQPTLAGIVVDDAATFSAYVRALYGLARIGPDGVQLPGGEVLAEHAPVAAALA